MKKMIYACLCGALVLSGCSSEFESPDRQAGGKAIAFQSYTGKGSATKAGSLDLDALRTAGFKVFAYDNVGNPGSFISNMGPASVTYDEDESQWTYTPMAEWPAGAADFIAYAPVDDDNVTAPVASTTEANRKVLTYTVPTDLSEQRDFLVASLTKTWATTSNTVQLGFSHGLSRLQFKVRYTSGGVTDITVDQISLLNLSQTATGTYTLSPTPASNAFAWSAQTGKVTYDLTGALENNKNIAKSLDYTDVISGDNAVMIMPQVTTMATSAASGVTPAAVTAAEATSEFYVLVKWTKNSTPASDKIALCAVPSPADYTKGITFEKNKSYTFTLSLDGLTDYITVGSVEVADWDQNTAINEVAPPAQ